MKVVTRFRVPRQVQRNVRPKGLEGRADRFPIVEIGRQINQLYILMLYIQHDSIGSCNR